MNKIKVRKLLQEFFKSRNRDQDIEILYPLMSRKRMDGILDGSEDFSKADVMLLMSVSVSLTGRSSTSMSPEGLALVQAMRDEMGPMSSIVGH